MLRARASLALVVLLAVAAAVPGAGCTPKFDPASLIKNERIIAVVADPPEAVPGASVTLTPIVVGLGGTLAEGDGYTAAWWRCPDDDSDSLGDFWQCTEASKRVELGGGVPYVDVVPEDLFGPLPPVPSVPPDPADPANPAEPDDDAADEGLGAAAAERSLGALLGYWRVVGLTVRGDDDRVVEGFKRAPVFLPVPLAQIDERLAAIDVRVAPEGGVTQTNTNPLLNAVTVHEGAVDGPTVDKLDKGGTYFFVPRYDARSLEAYQSLKADLSGLPLDDPDAMAALSVDELLPRFQKVQRCEIPIFNWYVTAGKVRREITLAEGAVADTFDPRGVACPPVEGEPRTADTAFTAPAGTDDDPLPEGGVVHAWVVMRDGRGGTAVRAFDLPVE
ncbi:MAG: hypothetical protein FJ137_23135 [Deltaproteobacteria bacterium]|nr:hypothetical protein [Deltaproteobacteria bacterium]